MKLFSLSVQLPYNTYSFTAMTELQLKLYAKTSYFLTFLHALIIYNHGSEDYILV